MTAGIGPSTSTQAAGADGDIIDRLDRQIAKHESLRSAHFSNGGTPSVEERMLLDARNEIAALRVRSEKALKDEDRQTEAAAVSRHLKGHLRERAAGSAARPQSDEERTVSPSSTDKPRSTYVPLEETQIESLRFMARERHASAWAKKQWDTLCDMAINSRLYAEEIERLRTLPIHSAVGNEAHEWDAEGETCMKCGDKDWMAGPVCRPRSMQSARRKETP